MRVSNNVIMYAGMSNGDQGAMGIHYANVGLIDGTADPLRPEALIYEPGTNGEIAHSVPVAEAVAHARLRRRLRPL